MGSVVAGLVLLALAVALYLTVRGALRRAPQPAWANGQWLSLFHVPLIVVALAFGVAFVLTGILSFGA
jgi:hypothetical protein